MPQVITADSGQGREFDHVVIDYVSGRADPKGMGFVRDEKRGCVIHTRGRKAMWIVGSDYNESPGALKEDDDGGWAEEEKTTAVTGATGTWDDSNAVGPTTDVKGGWDDTPAEHPTKAEDVSKKSKPDNSTFYGKKSKYGSKPVQTQTTGRKRVRKGKKGEDGQEVPEFAPLFYRNELSKNDCLTTDNRLLHSTMKSWQVL